MLFQPGFFTVIAGPCSIESYEHFSSVARFVSRNGASALRGGIFKTRTRADTFQGLGSEGFEAAWRVKRETGQPFVVEITDPRQLDTLGEIADVLQVGARNMHNTELLKELGRTRKPVLLKRGLSAYLDELLAACDYIVRGGNDRIILCERGIRTFETATRNTLDLSSVPYLKQKSGFPVFVDPSHGTGVASLVSPMCWAAAAAGADGVIVEVHPNPAQALSDGPQALTYEAFAAMTARLERVLAAMDRRLAPAPERATSHQIPELTV
jgi:3-deoxy-7-phosphoheptulonate synthase